MTRWILALVLAMHGLVHLMGFAKSFGYADLPQLTAPVPRPQGLLWLLAGLLTITSAIAAAVMWRHTWVVGACALVLSQALILSAWRDAWAGTIANVLLLLVVFNSWFSDGPRSFRAAFDRDVRAALERTVTCAQESTASRSVPTAEGRVPDLESRVPNPESRDESVITETDLAPLPEPVRRYLRSSGAVGQPRVRNYRLHFRGRIRSAPDSAWMPFEASQHSFADQPTRLFLMRATMSALPVSVFHRLLHGRATMQVNVMGVFPIVDASGEEMDRSETVTLFNDMCVLAPATLIDRGIQWEAVDDHTVHARFRNGQHTIGATLLFGSDDLLANFVSDDRSMASPDGKTFTRLRFSTPVRDYRDFGPARLAAHGEARWLLPQGEFTYGEFDLQDIAYNVSR